MSSQTGKRSYNPTARSTDKWTPVRMMGEAGRIDPTTLTWSLVLRGYLKKSPDSPLRAQVRVMIYVESSANIGLASGTSRDQVATPR